MVSIRNEEMNGARLIGHNQALNSYWKIPVQYDFHDLFGFILISEVISSGTMSYDCLVGVIA